MKEARFDRTILVLTSILLFIGIIAIYSASFIFALTRKGDPNYFLWRQLLFVLAGVAVLTATLNFPVKLLKNRNFILAVFGLQALALLVVMFAPKINGSHRWLKFAGFSIQPSEFAKIVVILLTAYALQKKIEKKLEWGHVIVKAGIPVLILFALIIIEPDMGMSAMLLFIAASMFFVAGLPWKGIVPIGAVLALGLAVLIIIAPYRLQRIVGNPDNDPQHSGFQVRQSLIAVGSGGVWGKTLGGGSQKRLFLPLPHTDFIFANIAEEMGLWGCSMILFLYLFFGYRGFRIAAKLQDPYLSYIAFGVTAWIVVQALIHISVNLYLLPPKGMPLPFISYGGSSMLSTMAGVGLLLNVSRQV
ncbi:MAG TPA: putative lipid II flippase FtsW [Acidobacteriota bacterium]|jgi:cell division protein FtsW|nr:putative lipid II flippase FtsW [Acidobacteriota bacterium]HNT17341.1 putative lipid II flippase FtsW [Acidobacteriota bacterium]